MDRATRTVGHPPETHWERIQPVPVNDITLHSIHFHRVFYSARWQSKGKQLNKCDSAIGKHFLSSHARAENYSDAWFQITSNAISFFQVASCLSMGFDSVRIQTRKLIFRRQKTVSSAVFGQLGNLPLSWWLTSKITQFKFSVFNLIARVKY